MADVYPQILEKLDAMDISGGEIQTEPFLDVCRLTLPIIGMPSQTEPTLKVSSRYLDCVFVQIQILTGICESHLYGSNEDKCGGT